MVRSIMKDPIFLAQKSHDATSEDLGVAADLLDTLKAHKDTCVGMAANMIGVSKRIIAVNMGFMNMAMFNPVIVSKKGPYETEEGCLRLLCGPRKTKRFRKIKVEYNPQKTRIPITVPGIGAIPMTFIVGSITN